MGVAYEDRQSIENKKAQYCRFADTHEWDNFAALFTPDCALEFLDANGQGFYDMGPHSTIPSARDLGNYLVQLRNVQQAIHMVGPLEFEQVDQDTIKTICTVTYQVGAIGVPDGVHGVGGGHYYETWTRKDGEWLISQYLMKRLYYKSIVIPKTQ